MHGEITASCEQPVRIEEILIDLTRAGMQVSRVLDNGGARHPDTG